MRPPEDRTKREVAGIRGEVGLAQVLWSVIAEDYETTDSALNDRAPCPKTTGMGVRRAEPVASVLVARDGAGTRAGSGPSVLAVFCEGGLRKVAGGDAGQGL